MSKIKYIGRTTDFKGKTLWEIVGNLKDFGVGRVIARSMFERYPEPCFMRILKVQALPNEDPRKVRVTVEKTFRGRTLPRPTEICSTSYKADYKLIPKSEEEQYCKITSAMQERILPSTIDFPPLLKEFIVEETGNQNPVLNIHFKERLNKYCRIAKEGETPNVKVTMGLGTPASPKLYENVKL
ncbi:unnamed protein product [Hermetia illucens]|uniref:Mitochondrial ribosomal protein S34 n=1 Tax=Hermetia illucens TaxID=343691 RepID=A0A7R8UMX2_HERIL|nr:uncharacterized protein LOC119649676 [Hermetia illucens]CAD7083554.1 unnamed protein product [Hermetia illucens]